jgi:hypothetical protein
MGMNAVVIHRKGTLLPKVSLVTVTSARNWLGMYTQEPNLSLDDCIGKETTGQRCRGNFQEDAVGPGINFCYLWGICIG